MNVYSQVKTLIEQNKPEIFINWGKMKVSPALMDATTADLFSHGYEPAHNDMVQIVTAEN